MAFGSSDYDWEIDLNHQAEIARKTVALMEDERRSLIARKEMREVTITSTSMTFQRLQRKGVKVMEERCSTGSSPRRESSAAASCISIRGPAKSASTHTGSTTTTGWRSIRITSPAVCSQ
jgi:hypothetical protein